MNLEALIHSAHEQNLHILHIVVRQKGEITAEHEFSEETPEQLWSVSKTFTSMAIGIAAHEGYFDIHDKLAKYFPAAAREKFDQLTLRDLLCMGTGQAHCPLDKARQAKQNLDDIESLFFAEPIIYKPGTHFTYNNAATYMLSKLISLQTGTCLLDFLRPRLFEPLGITDVQWVQDVNGINFGCAGLQMDVHDLSKFGQLLLDEGEWNGKSLIPRQYLREATRKQIDNADFSEPFATADHKSGYGYQLWMNSYPGSYRLDGLYGQYVVVIPNKQAVITYISNEPTNMTGILELTRKFIVDQL
jgi:CubicO group peptidase (beta-lactamase class C family)